MTHVVASTVPPSWWTITRSSSTHVDRVDPHARPGTWLHDASAGDRRVTNAQIGVDRRRGVVHHLERRRPRSEPEHREPTIRLGRRPSLDVDADPLALQRQQLDLGGRTDVEAAGRRQQTTSASRSSRCHPTIDRAAISACTTSAYATRTIRSVPWDDPLV